MKSSESVHISKKQLSMSKYREDKNAKIKKKTVENKIYFITLMLYFKTFQLWKMIATYTFFSNNWLKTKLVMVACGEAEAWR